MGEVKIPVKLFIIQPLRLQNKGQLQHPVLRPSLIQPEKGNQALIPPGCRPVKKRTVCHMQQQIMHRPVYRLFDPVIPAAFIIQHQHLADQKCRPNVIGAAFLPGTGTDPAVLLLTLQNGVYVSGRTFF